LVDKLRQRGAFTLSLVVENGGQVVAHALFTPVDVVEDEGSWTAVALGPVAVSPSYQKQGIGHQLIRAGLAMCHERGDDIVAVLGHPTYYPRFGFVPAVRYGIKSEYDVPDDVFMLIELREGALAGRRGIVNYQAEFNEV
jgi:putative acetyltransferase